LAYSRYGRTSNRHNETLAFPRHKSCQDETTSGHCSRVLFVHTHLPMSEADFGQVNHISQDGLVPIVAAGKQGKQFRRHHQLVEISAPVHQAQPEHVIVVLLDDLHLFCQVWFYSALSYPALNHHLRTTFTLQDPYYPADPKPISIQLQKKLLFPFEIIKGLYQTEAEGYDEDVKAELEKRMAKPADTVQKCCEDCAELMTQGDQILAEGDAKKAMELYIQAFRSIHIIITGRTRRVLGDPFFHDGIESGRFSGQSGTTVRVILRIKLVHRVVAAYIKLSQWEEAAFWGMRSIRIMRENMETEFEEFLSEFVGAEDVGLLYLHTAIAMKKMEDYNSLELVHYGGWNGLEGSDQLFTMVAKYMKGRMQGLVKKELDSNRIGIPDSLAKAWEGAKKVESDKDSMRHLNQDEDTEVEGDGDVDRSSG
jgi:hypothetical protein